MPQPVLFRLLRGRPGRAPGAGQTRGAGPRTMVPTTASHGQQFSISGHTLDNAGANLGNCVVHLFDSVTDVLVTQGMSDAGGAYLFYAQGGRTYYIVAYKPGSPDVAGTTVNTLTVA